jgi:hypothetical protein
MTNTLSSDRTISQKAAMGSRRSANFAMWAIQVLLAAMFVFAGGMKLVMPVEMMTRESSLPGLFLRFIGCAEVLGAFGLVLPWGFRIRRELTPIAAMGLIVIMVGATVITVHANGLAPALVPLFVACLLATVAYGRWSALASEEGGQHVLVV